MTSDNHRSAVRSHAVHDRLARQPGYSASLKRCCAAPRHSVRLFKQSPEHHDGRGSCLAVLGSDGVAGGSVPGPQSGDFTPQPASSRLSSSGAASGQFQFFSCTLALLVRQSLAALFFGSGLGRCAPVALGNLQSVVGQGLVGSGGFGARISCSTISYHNPVLLAAGNQYQGDQPPTPGRHCGEPGHTSARRIPSSMIAGVYGFPPFSWMMMLTTIPRSVAASLMFIGSVARTPRRLATAPA
jgi:hypothetical protein